MYLRGVFDEYEVALFGGNLFLSVTLGGGRIFDGCRGRPSVVFFSW